MSTIHRGEAAEKIAAERKVEFEAKGTWLECPHEDADQAIAFCLGYPAWGAIALCPACFVNLSSHCLRVLSELGPDLDAKPEAAREGKPHA